MFKKKKVQKENHISYFFGGTAIGMAAGLLAGKLFSSTSAESTQNSEPKVFINKHGNKYSQDDNIHKSYFQESRHHYQRSKSASRYEDKNYTKQPLSAVSLSLFDDNSQNNINNLDLNHRCDKNIHKVLYDNKHTLYNITTEDNAKCNVPADMLLENFKEIQSEDNVNTKEENLIEIINSKSMDNFNGEKILKHKKICENTKLTDTFNSLSINFCEGNSTYKSPQNINSSITRSSLFPSYTNNASNIATCNDTFCEDEYNNILDFISIEEFYETDVISSTKQNDLEDT